MKNISHCILIPNYNHSNNFEALIDLLASFSLPIIVVNDGSDDSTTELLRVISTQRDTVDVLHLTENRGKGGAVKAGIKYAANAGFTHALQIDADGQHDFQDISKFIALSRANPEALITGLPIYDESVPKSRLIGRYITHFWVWIETLSFKIKDSMCGFRVYPIQLSLALIENNKVGERMDFDTEIMVHSFWQGIDILPIPTKVSYPEDGVSHFRLVKDNWLISKMHTRLFFGMLRRLPGWLVSTKKLKKEKHWGSLGEKGSVLGISTLFWIYRVLGRGLFLVILYPVIAYYVLSSTSARHASKKYLQHIEAFIGTNKPVKWYQVYAHFYAFGVSAIDKIGSWSGKITRSQVVIHNPELFAELEASPEGAVFLGSHLGNLELCRALGEKGGKFKINAVVFNKNALKFQQLVRKNSEESQLNLIHAEDMGIGTAILLKQKVDASEIVVIVGDRTSIKSTGRVQYADFLGEQAPFSEGPFIMAGILRCPVYLIFCLKEKGIYNIYLEKFADSSELPRRNKEQFLQQQIQKYADRLAYYCIKAPKQWFNFFNFWHNDDAKDIERGKH